MITDTILYWSEQAVSGLGDIAFINAIFGVQLVSMLQDSLGEEKLDSLVYAVLGGTLLMVGIITLARALILARTLNERDDFKIELRHKIAAVTIGVTTGFVIGISVDTRTPPPCARR